MAASWHMSMTSKSQPRSHFCERSHSSSRSPETLGLPWESQLPVVHPHYHNLQCHLLFRFGETPFSWAVSKSWVTWTKFCHFLSKLAFDIIQPSAQCEWHQGLLRPLLSKDGSKQEEGDEEVAFAFPPKESSMRRRWLSLEYFPERNPGWGGGCELRRKECLLARF